MSFVKTTNRVPEQEISKRPELGAVADRFNVLFLEKYLAGRDYDDLSREYNISKGQVQIHLNDVMQKLPERLKMQPPEKKVMTECLRYKEYWMNLISNYKMGLQLYNNNAIFITFMAYFKKQDARRREYMIKQLEEHL